MKLGSGYVDVYEPNLKLFHVMDNIIKFANGNKNTENSVVSK